MRAFSTVTGPAIVFRRDNVDTDVIMPSRWLKTVGRTGLGKGAFEALRGDPDNVFDRGHGAPFLIAGENFGCGSSREHAAWALADLGIRAVVAPSFADIFAGNAFKNGILLVTLPTAAIDVLAGVASLTIDLQLEQVRAEDHAPFAFVTDPFRRRCLLDGSDEIDLTLSHADDIATFERADATARPWAGGMA